MFAFDSLSVAPMEGFTTFPMRVFLRMTSNPSAMTTPFLKVTRVFPEGEIPFEFVPELYDLRGLFPYSIIPQFISGETESFLRAVDMMPEAISRTIELNCGCPSPNSMGKHAGSGILQDPEVFRKALERIISELGPERVAIKMRVGILSDAEFPDLLSQMESLRFARLTIHGRSRKAGYRGRANWQLVEAAAKTFAGRIPVHASGDVVSWSSLKSLHDAAPSASGVMIGRGVLRNPWIFEECRRGEPVVVSRETFLLALYSYLLIQELWQNEPMKLIHRLQSQRIGAYLGTDPAAWEKTAVELSGVALGIPLLPWTGGEMRVSPVAFDRLKILWTYLRGSLPEDLRLQAVGKAKHASEFFELLDRALRTWDAPLRIEIPEEN